MQNSEELPTPSQQPEPNDSASCERQLGRLRRAGTKGFCAPAAHHRQLTSPARTSAAARSSEAGHHHSDELTQQLLTESTACTHLKRSFHKTFLNSFYLFLLTTTTWVAPPKALGFTLVRDKAFYVAGKYLLREQKLSHWLTELKKTNSLSQSYVFSEQYHCFVTLSWTFYQQA